MWKYVFFLITIHTVGRLPLTIGYAVAEVVGRIAYWLAVPLRRNVIRNLRNVMAEETPDSAIRRAARSVFVNVTKYYVDLVRMPQMDLQDFYDRRFRYFGFDEYLLPAVALGKGVAVISIHLGNPELAVQGMLPRGVSVLALTEPLEPPRLSQLVDSLRASKGHTFAPVGFAGVRQAIRTLRNGGVVTLMGDRDIEGPKAHLPFFGKKTLMPTGPIALALRTGATVIPSYSERKEGSRIEAHLLEPMELERTGDSERDVRVNTVRFLALAEGWIRKHPEQWVVLESVWDKELTHSEPPAVAVGEKT